MKPLFSFRLFTKLNGEINTDKDLRMYHRITDLSFKLDVFITLGISYLSIFGKVYKLIWINITCIQFQRTQFTLLLEKGSHE